MPVTHTSDKHAAYGAIHKPEQPYTVVRVDAETIRTMGVIAPDPREAAYRGETCMRHGWTFNTPCEYHVLAATPAEDAKADYRRCPYITEKRWEQWKKSRIILYTIQTVVEDEVACRFCGNTETMHECTVAGIERYAKQHYGKEAGR